MGDGIFEGPPKQNAKFLKQHGPRNPQKQSPEEGPKLDPKKSGTRMILGSIFWGLFFCFCFWLSWASHGWTWASLGNFWAALGSCSDSLGSSWASLTSSWGHLGSLLTRIRSLLAHPVPAVPHLEPPFLSS